MSDLEGQVAVVTGSSRGIGRAIAEELARHGARIIVNYVHSAEAALEVVQAIQALGSEAVAIEADVSRADGASALVTAALAAFGTIDILVNNAGIARDAVLMRLSEDDWDAVIDTHLKGAYLCTKAVQRTMLKARHGCIVNIGSVVGLRGNAGQANYAAAKAGLVGFTKAMARELASRHITVNLVAPGFIQTDMTARLPEATVQEALAQIPLGHLGQPQDVAAAVVFLCSPAARYITGQVLCVDGGMAM